MRGGRRRNRRGRRPWPGRGAPLLRGNSGPRRKRMGDPAPDADGAVLILRGVDVEAVRSWKGGCSPPADKSNAPVFSVHRMLLRSHSTMEYALCKIT